MAGQTSSHAGFGFILVFVLASPLLVALATF